MRDLVAIVYKLMRRARRRTSSPAEQMSVDLIERRLVHNVTRDPHNVNPSPWVARVRMHTVSAQTRGDNGPVEPRRDRWADPTWDRWDDE